MYKMHEEEILVSVIITCYNHGKFLKQAVESTIDQGLDKLEIIVVDDGSSDHTAEVAQQLPVRYVYQANQGLSAARNTGVKQSRGKYLAFLDADDYFKKGGLRTNMQILQRKPYLALVVGSHEKVYEKTGEVFICNEIVKEDHFYHMLIGNYIGMHAAVLYSRWVLNEFLFDTRLKMCEDYDIYLKIMRKYEVVHHEAVVAAYRIHNTNMSSNFSKMLKAALYVLRVNKKLISSPREKDAYRAGGRFWKKYYTQEMINELKGGKINLDYYGFWMLINQSPRILSRSIAAKLKSPTLAVE
ncbi:glycosyltransferase family 2 protein [Litoribacter populi]|uniref:glycosyltransferase family 2 protein n=1 Tax=Litoribacter populi TaxID=2598460 RepID=UPI00117E76EA|nr:glycosyltransferase family 2 protein [Litoribacter populi]